MNVKALAYDALVECAIHSLPIEVKDFRLNNVYVFSWQQYLLQQEKPIHSNIYKQDGAVMCLRSKPNARHIIFYNDNLPEVTKRWVIAKLLYYVRSGFAEEHVGQYITPDEDSKATEFASCFMCPDAVLVECSILNEKDIMHYCQVPFSIARRKARYLKNGYNKFKLPSLENLVKKQFLNYTRKK